MFTKIQIRKTKRKRKTSQSRFSLVTTRNESTTKSKRKKTKQNETKRFSIENFQYKIFASNQPELYRPIENDDDDEAATNLTAKEIEQEA